ncbi:hypothetical protein GWI33_001792 [Rhynchophorus ferrugineus]|uniref:Uncharacterized protein n=1 Tax=Rhynchophorus ferrugineus TaxID=354439 RepID=A0A834ILB7_RHYFE|nr:hypothetical protein GWI33_001792 [Rhynchophorus ferrugineus]
MFSVGNENDQQASKPESIPAGIIASCVTVKTVVPKQRWRRRAGRSAQARHFPIENYANNHVGEPMYFLD